MNETRQEQRVGDTNGAVARLRNRLVALEGLQRALAVYVAAGGGLPIPVVCVGCPERRRGAGRRPRKQEEPIAA